ncbi:MAG: DUF1573 domain-containing protein [Sphingobacteriales bacterium]|nr:DUF1573 domain-containing protein [Sphingobacteriales bacterium]MBI3719118.1 DUF1573 domain-containing protein [Sphingobacteriales bacterium]
MKQVFSAFVALVFANIVMAQTKVSDKVKFASEIVDLGTVKQGNPVTGTFTLTNIGQEPLIIESVTPGCGCTKSDYTKEPIMPGKTGSITATYNAAAAGNFSKMVTIKFKGIDEQKTVSITGKVVANDAAVDAQTKVTPAAPAVVPAATTTAAKVTTAKAKKTKKTAKS